MPLGDGGVWDESNPQQSTLVNQGPLYETDFKIGVRKRLANEHIWPSTQTDVFSAGQHTYVSFQPQAATPIIPVVNGTTQSGILFTTSGVLQFENSAGTLTTLVASAGGVSIINATYSLTGSQGDLFIGSANGVVKVLPGSVDGDILVTHSNTADPTWSSPSILGIPLTLNNLRIQIGTGGLVSGGSHIDVSYTTNFAVAPTVVITPLWLTADTSDQNTGMLAVSSVTAVGFRVYNTDDLAKQFSYLAIGSK